MGGFGTAAHVADDLVDWSVARLARIPLAPLLLNGQERALLAQERQFEAADAGASVASAEAVLLVLPVFLDDPHLHGGDLEDRRLHIRVARDLSEKILRASLQRGVDVGRAAGVVDAAVRHEISMLPQESAAGRGAERGARKTQVCGTSAHSRADRHLASSGVR